MKNDYVKLSRLKKYLFKQITNSEQEIRTTSDKQKINYYCGRIDVINELLDFFKKEPSLNDFDTKIHKLVKFHQKSSAEWKEAAKDLEIELKRYIKK